MRRWPPRSVSHRRRGGRVGTASPSDLTDKALCRGVFHSVPDLIVMIEAYLQADDDNPRPFVWTASADAVLGKGSAAVASPSATSPASTGVLH